MRWGLRIIKKIVDATGDTGQVIFGLVGGALGGWLLGLFIHSVWWAFKALTGQPFYFTSGLEYTLLYALFGAVIGLWQALTYYRY